MSRSNVRTMLYGNRLFWNKNISCETRKGVVGGQGSSSRFALYSFSVPEFQTVCVRALFSRIVKTHIIILLQCRVDKGRAAR